MNEGAWPFEDARDTAVFTTKEVVEDGAVITYVTHDANDGAWQFHSASQTSELDDARMVALSTICSLDSSIVELSDLPMGWHAWRPAKDANWVRAISKD